VLEQGRSMRRRQCWEPVLHCTAVPLGQGGEEVEESGVKVEPGMKRE